MPSPTATPPSGPRPSAVVSPRAVTAHLRHFRMSPRKMRLVAKTVSRMPAVAAVDYLRLLRKDAALPLAKLMASAIANAKHNFQLPPADLVVEKILVNQGPTLKRYRPRAFGRAGEILRRSCHVSLTLVSRGAKPAVAAAAKLPSDPAAVKTVSLTDVRRQTAAGGDRGPGAAGAAPASGGKGFTRKMFQRKAG